MLTATLVAVLRVLGLIWAIGGVIIMRNARAAGDTDALRWVFLGGALTFGAGLFLAAGSRWAAIPAVLLVAHQAWFHWRQVRDLPPGAPRPRPTHAVIALLVTAAILILVSKGALV